MVGIFFIEEPQVLGMMMNSFVFLTVFCVKKYVNRTLKEPEPRL